MTITVTALQKQRRDTASNWTASNPVLLAGEIGIESDTGKWKVGNGSTAWASLSYIPAFSLSAYPLVNADISGSAEIAVSKLADGTARQLLQTDAAGTGVEWTSNVDIPGTLDVTGTATFDGSVTIQGDLTVNGTTTTIDTANLVVEDKNIEIGKVTTPTDVTADGGGITLKGSTDKTIQWIDATDAWTFSEHVNIASTKEYRIAGTKVLDATSLGSGVVSSSLTSVGTIGTGIWNGTAIGTAYGGTGQTTYTDGQLLIGKTDGTLAKATLTAGSNITITNGDGTISIASSGGATYTAGDGLDLVGNTFSTDLKANGGLVIESTELAVDLGASSITGTLGVADGGTGQTTYTDGQLLIGNSTGNTLSKSTLTAGSGITITNGSGSITIAASGGGGTVTSVTGTAPISVANGTTTPDISIAAASTSVAGAVQLTDSTSSTSTTTAATPNAVKSAYDLANAALPKAGGTMTGNITFSGTQPTATTTTPNIVQLTDSTSSTSVTTAATPNSVKSAYDLANAALPKAGGAMTGDLTLNAQSDLRFADSDSSNWVAFQAPATVASNVTWTLPSADGSASQVLSTNGSGTLSWATAGGGGKILQVVQTVKTDTFSRTSSSSDFGDITGLSATITPASTANKILVIASVTCASPSNTRHAIRITAAGSVITAVTGNADSLRTRATSSGYNIGTGSDNATTNLTIKYLHSPSTTSSRTYQVQGSAMAGNTFYCNRSATNADSDQVYVSASTIILMEVAA